MTQAIAPTVVTYPHIEAPVTLLPGDVMRGVQIEVDGALAKALRKTDGKVFVNGPDFESIGMIGRLLQDDDTEIIGGDTFLTSIYIEGRARLVDLERKGGVDYALIEPLELATDVDPGVIQTALDRMHETLAGHLSDNAFAAAMMQLEDTAMTDPEMLAGTLMSILYGAQLIEDDREDNKKLLEAVDLAEQLVLIDGILKKAEAEKKRLLAVTKAKPSAMPAKINSEPENEFDVMEKQIEEANMPEEARKKAEEMLKELRETNPPMGQTFNKTKKKLKTIIAYPWNKSSEIVSDIAYARQVLDADHSGMEEPKEEILEHLGVQQRAGGKAGAGILLSGAPGVGKTSLGKSVAKALGREFARVSLGGVSDEAAIRGYDDNYVTAAPGKIIRAIAKTGTNNPVVLLDEIDKLGASDQHGDPSAALLEVLDPAQNSAFRDNYMDLDMDLSNVIFLATANYLEKIDAPLLDRLNLIKLPAYTEDDKFAIAKEHLIGKQLEETHVPADKFTLTDEALRALIDGYSVEAGVRILEQKIGKTMRKAGLKIDETGKPVVVRPEDLEKYVGKQRLKREKADPTPTVGRVYGLYASNAGGGFMPLKGSMYESTGGGLEMTGSLSEVSKESVKNAYTFVRVHARQLGIDPAMFEKYTISIKFGDGATPKDGPSAGLALATLIVSTMTGIPIRGDVAFTGEIDPDGEAKIIGGLEQKLPGAQKAGIKTVILPRSNMDDLDEVPKSVLEKLTIKPIDNEMEGIKLALEYMPTPFAEQKQEQAATLAGVDPQALGQLLKLAQAFSQVSQPAPVNDDVKPAQEKALTANGGKAKKAGAKPKR